MFVEETRANPSNFAEHAKIINHTLLWQNNIATFSQACIASRVVFMENLIRQHLPTKHFAPFPADNLKPSVHINCNHKPHLTVLGLLFLNLRTHTQRNGKFPKSNPIQHCDLLLLQFQTTWIFSPTANSHMWSFDTVTRTSFQIG